MKYIFIFILLFFFILENRAQKGLENISIEKYYIANEQDTLLNTYLGSLVPGAITYRIYVDLLPGYRLQAVYGTKKHPLHIRTSTFFYNNADLGDVTPITIPRKALKKNTVMLDSWLTIGTAAEQFVGIPKADDDSLFTIVHEKGFLRNKGKEMDYSLQERDGLHSVANTPKVVLFGLDSVSKIFAKKCIGGDFYVDNGAWGTLGKGVVGADSLGKNYVLIAQLTTDGILDFELNIQVGTPDGKVQNFVAKNPEQNEFEHPSLIYTTLKEEKNKKLKNKK